MEKTDLAPEKLTKEAFMALPEKELDKRIKELYKHIDNPTETYEKGSSTIIGTIEIWIGELITSGRLSVDASTLTAAANKREPEKKTPAQLFFMNISIEKMQKLIHDLHNLEKKEFAEAYPLGEKALTKDVAWRNLGELLIRDKMSYTIMPAHSPIPDAVIVEEKTEAEQIEKVDLNKERTQPAEDRLALSLEQSTIDLLNQFEIECFGQTELTLKEKSIFREDVLIAGIEARRRDHRNHKIKYSRVITTTAVQEF